MHKILYYSDCPFFAGCENMLINFFNSKELKQCYEVSFVYRKSERYEHGFKQKFKGDLIAHGINFPELSDCEKIPGIYHLAVKRLIATFLRIVLIYPVLLCEILVLYRLFKREKPDILHVNNGGYPGALSARAAAIAAKLAKVPKTIMVVNNMAVGYKNIYRWIDFLIDLIVIRSVNIFITGSVSASNRLKEVLNLTNSKLATIHNGISIGEAKEGKSGTRERLGLTDFKGVIFGVVALLIPRKGHQVLLDAVLKIVSESRIKNIEFKVLIEGDGPLKEELSKFVEMNGLHQWVSFVGHESNIVDFMTLMDVLILPSVENEDFPNVILEAMALGKPVVASRIAGTPEQIEDNITGLLVEPRNICQLANSICILAENADLRAEMSLAASCRFFTKFTSSNSVNNYIKLYQNLINDSK